MDIFTAQRLAIKLMGQHELIQQGWAFRMDYAKRRFGVCKYRSKVISLSIPLTRLNSEAEVRDTILHEIAHALCPKHNHDNVWKAKCVEIGCRPERCYDETVAQPPARYHAKCICGIEYKRHKRPNRQLVCRCQKHKAPGSKFILVWQNRFGPVVN